MLDRKMTSRSENNWSPGPMLIIEKSTDACQGRLPLAKHLSEYLEDDSLERSKKDLEVAETHRIHAISRIGFQLKFDAQASGVYVFEDV